MSPSPPETAPQNMPAARVPSSAIRLSACIIAKNAAHTLPDTLQSLRFCDEVVVIVDSSSTDATERIARDRANIIEVRPWNGFSEAWRHALSRGQGQWLLMIAADEIITPALAQSIIEAMQRDENRYHGYLMRRRTRFLGRWINHGDWGRDCVLRMVKRDQVAFNDALIHESLKNPGHTRVLDGLLLHEGERTIEEHIARQNIYTTLSAQSMYDQKRRASLFSLIVKPRFRFFRSYVLRFGFLDGWPGFVQAWYSSVYVYSRYAKLRELHRRAKTS